MGIGYLELGIGAFLLLRIIIQDGSGKAFTPVNRHQSTVIFY